MNYSIGTHKGMRGHEGPGFQVMLLDSTGRKVARVTDYGDGSISLSWEFMAKTAEQRAADAQLIEAYARTLNLKYVIADDHSDAMVHRLVHLHLTKKDLIRHMRKGAVLFDKAKKQYAITAYPYDEAGWATLAAKNPHMTVLNTMDLDKAAELVSEVTE